MPVEWVAQTDLLKCVNCGSNISEGEAVVGDVDEFFHKNADECDITISKK